MPQMTIYLPDEVEKKARQAAKANKTSVSRWIARQVMDAVSDQWPESVLDAAGAYPDFPDLKEIRRGYGSDAPRSTFE